MPTVAPTGNGDQVAVPKQNGGTVIKGGGLSSESPMTKSLTLSDLADDQGRPHGSRVIAKDGSLGEWSDNVGISGAKVGGIVAGVTQLGYKADSTEWVVVGGNVTQTLAGSSYDGLVGGAAGPDPTRDHVNQIESTRVYGLVDVDIFAVPSSGYNSFVTKSSGPGGAGGSVSNFVRPSGAGDQASADTAANTTRALPGELTYMFGGKAPQTTSYKAKDSAES
jgi:hypothetical protein